MQNVLVLRLSMFLAEKIQLFLSTAEPIDIVDPLQTEGKRSTTESQKLRPHL